jgi:hypothetical protein
MNDAYPKKKDNVGKVAFASPVWCCRFLTRARSPWANLFNMKDTCFFNTCFRNRNGQLYFVSKRSPSIVRSFGH